MKAKHFMLEVIDGTELGIAGLGDYLPLSGYR